MMGLVVGLLACLDKEAPRLETEACQTLGKCYQDFGNAALSSKCPPEKETKCEERLLATLITCLKPYPEFTKNMKGADLTGLGDALDKNVPSICGGEKKWKACKKHLGPEDKDCLNL